MHIFLCLIMLIYQSNGDIGLMKVWLLIQGLVKYIHKVGNGSAL